MLRQEDLLQQIDSILSKVKGHDFKLVSVDPQTKDGGVFVNFTYNGAEEKLSEVIGQIRAAGDASGGFPSWIGLKRVAGSVWQVKGEPWLEVCYKLHDISLQCPDLSRTSTGSLLRC